MNNKFAFIVFSGILLFNLPLLFSDSKEKVAQDVIIDIGDELQILLKEDSSFQFRGLVDDSGNVTLNYVGEINAVNYTLKEFETRLKKILLENFYNKVTLSVSIIKQASRYVFIYGAVQEPGSIEIPGSGRISIPQTLSAVKGLSTWADPENAYILRANQSDSQEKEYIDIQATVNRVLKENLVYLYGGDELYIPSINQDSSGDTSQLLTTVPREVIVVGQIRAPGIQLFAPGEDATLMRAIFKAGGMTQFAQGNEVKLIRYRGDERTIQVVNINRVIEKGYLEEDVDLKSGDMIIIPQKFINL
ncbi:MAG: polysaccharide biosynthesis/export family protein [Crocinitomicaceae bacterium]